MERIDGKKFVEGVLGRTTENFAARVAGTYYLEQVLDGQGLPEVFKEKLLRLISKEDLEKIDKAYGKIK